MYPELTENLETALAISRPVNDEKYAALYPGIWEYTDVISELSFRIPSIDIIEKRLSNAANGKTYMYLFNRRGTKNDWIGSCHAGELGYAFNNREYDNISGKADPKLAAAFSSALVAFARTGDPSTAGNVWPEYDMTDRATMIMNDDCSMTIENDPKSTMRQLLKDIIIF